MSRSFEASRCFDDPAQLRVSLDTGPCGEHCDLGSGFVEGIWKQELRTAHISFASCDRQPRLGHSAIGQELECSTRRPKP